VGLVAVAAGCDGAGPGPGPIPDELRNEPVQTEARLESFAGCEELEQHIEDNATRQMRVSLEWLKNRRGGWLYGDDRADGAPPSPSTGSPQEDSGGGVSGAPQNHTETNNQTEGVHEADFVQNDGTRIFVLSGPRLYVHRSWPAEQLTLASTVEVEGWPREMLLDKTRNRLVIASQVYEKRPGRTSWGGGTGVAVDCAGFYCGYSYGDTLKVTVLDVADVAAPRVVEQVYLPGHYFNARRVEGTVRLVMSDQFRWPEGIRYYADFPREVYEDKNRLNAAVEALMQENEQRIRAQRLEQWLPPGRRINALGQVSKLEYACTDFMRNNAPTGLGFVTVLSLGLDPGALDAPPHRTSLVASPGEVYASKESLYVATNHWWWRPEADQIDSVYLHKFDIRQAGRAAYVSSGTVEGHVLNQFAMDEHEGVLRLALTVTKRVRDEQNPNWIRTDTVNRVVTVGEQDGRLKELGRSADLAQGERIFSSRFVGNKGYVVTFRQVDPLFSFDLSDPARPRKVGELKIPGFSTYIHPVGDSHLLTFGEHRDDTGNWGSRALKLSLFDVSDLAHPRETFTQVVGSASSSSEALWEHKAFNYFAAKGLLAVPYTEWNYYASDYWSSFRTELRVFRLNTATGFTPVGAISMNDTFQAINQRNWTWYWQPSVRRSVMADDYVYAISDAGVRVSNVSALGTPLATTRFQPPVP
jgi:hypothetical protein